MKTISTQSGMLANHEVFAHIKSVQSRNTSKSEYNAAKTVTHSDGTTRTELSGNLRGLNHVVSEAMRYFEGSHGYTGTPSATTIATKSRGKTPTHKLLRDLEPYRLTKTELMNILNHRPQAIDQLEPLIEEASERFSLQEQLDIVRIVGDVLGRPQPDSTNRAG